MIGNFLKKLKKKKVNPPTSEDRRREAVEERQTADITPQSGIDGSQLKVDIFRSPSAIIIYAQIAGASAQDFSVMMQGDGDVITIRGQRIRPNGQVLENNEDRGTENVLEECSWGRFYRQIILPAEVDSSKTEAKMKNGVLRLSLPLKGVFETGGTRIEVKEV